jgi:colicin import membrane protein
MDKIIKVLKKNKLNESMLPTSIQQKIDEIEKLILKHNGEVDELDGLENVTEEQEQNIEKQSAMIDSQEDEICNEIEDFIETREKAVEEADKKAKSDAQKLAEEEADKKAKEEAENKKPEPKKKSGLGMFILGAVVLVATAGVVNVMSKK